MRTRTLTGALGALVLSSGAAVALASPAHAQDPDCRIVTTEVVDWPDNGHGTTDPDDTAALTPGHWADLTFARTVEICETPGDPLSSYRATVVDDGGLVTRAGQTLSPRDGAALRGGVTGTFRGGFTADFQALPGFASFDADHLHQQTVAHVGDGSHPTTGSWVRSMFSQDFQGRSLNDDWGWTYETCSESWWAANDPASDDGKTAQAGDITGADCPPVTDVTAPTCDDTAQTVTVTNPDGNADPVSVAFDDQAATSVAPGESASHRAAAAVSVAIDDEPQVYPYEEPADCPAATPSPGGEGAGEELPATGAPSGLLAGAALALVGLGGALFLLARRRGTRFTA